MKKAILGMMVAMSAMMFASCNNAQSAKDSASQAKENVATQTTVEKAEKPADTTEAVTRGGSDSEGFGRCSKCACNEFEGRGNVCKNCGHAYKKHY